MLSSLNPLRLLARLYLQPYLESAIKRLEQVGEQNPEPGVRNWAKDRAKSYWQVLAFLKGETTLETEKDFPTPVPPMGCGPRLKAAIEQLQALLTDEDKAKIDQYLEEERHHETRDS